MAPPANLLALYLAHRGKLVNYANRIVGDRGHAEDVVQEAYLRFDAATGKRMVDDPLSYLYRIVHNLALDMHGRLRSDRSRFVAEAPGGEPQSAGPSLEAAIEARDELRLMAQAMAELPERTRIALELHRFGGCTFRQIAAHLDISVGLAHALVVEGLEHCQERLCRR